MTKWIRVWPLIPPESRSKIVCVVFTLPFGKLSNFRYVAYPGIAVRRNQREVAEDEGGSPIRKVPVIHVINVETAQELHLGNTIWP